MSKHKLEPPAVSYDADFYEWCLETAQLIRQRRFDEVDTKHVAEEIEDMGKRDKREVRSRLIMLMMHLLKWQAQPHHRNKPSWQRTIREQRRQLELVLNDSPSLVRIARSQIQSLYPETVERATYDGLAAEHFPKQCPFTVEQLLNPDFFLVISDTAQE